MPRKPFTALPSQATFAVTDDQLNQCHQAGHPPKKPTSPRPCKTQTNAYLYMAGRSFKQPKTGGYGLQKTEKKLR
jgi:hypothetical protein